MFVYRFVCLFVGLLGETSISSLLSNDCKCKTLDFRFYAETCNPPWTELKKRCYLVIEAQFQLWKDVQSQCLKLNSLMVTISSEEENEFVHQLVQVSTENNNENFKGVCEIDPN